jgi:hypothetical protein
LEFNFITKTQPQNFGVENFKLCNIMCLQGKRRAKMKDRLRCQEIGFVAERRWKRAKQKSPKSKE